MKVFRRVLPWVDIAIKQLAGLPPDALVGPEGRHGHILAFIAAHDKYSLGARSGCDNVIAIHERQNKEWEELTKVPPLATPNDWWTAATRAGSSPPAHFGPEDFERFASCIIGWALDRRADASVKQDANDVIAADTQAEDEREARPFVGGEMVFYADRVKLCGANICSGSRAKRHRATLELLAKKDDSGAFEAYSCMNLAELVGISPNETDARKRESNAAGHVRHLRQRISKALEREASIICGDEDVILSGGPGYRLADCLSVRFDDQPMITDITDIEDADDVRYVPYVDVRDVFDVRDDEATRRRAWILQQLRDGMQLKAPMVAAHFKRSKKTAQRDLDALRDAGKIEFVGDPRTGYYRLCQRPPADQ